MWSVQYAAVPHVAMQSPGVAVVLPDDDVFADVDDGVKEPEERVATDLDGCVALFVQLYGLAHGCLKAYVERALPKRPDVNTAGHKVFLVRQ